VVALATRSDVVARLGRALTETESQRVDALLTDASAAVRLYTGQQFTAGTSTETIYPERGRVVLPQRPVNAVTAAEDTDGNDIAFTWHVGDTVYLTSSGTQWRLDLDSTSPFPAVITYTHGYAAGSIPEPVVAIVCNVVLRSLGRTPLDSGVTQQAIAGYSETIGAVGAAGAVGFLNEEKAALDRYRRPGRVLAGGW
jgi:hypothetical protein